MNDSRISLPGIEEDVRAYMKEEKETLRVSKTLVKVEDVENGYLVRYMPPPLSRHIVISRTQKDLREENKTAYISISSPYGIMSCVKWYYGEDAVYPGTVPPVYLGTALFHDGVKLAVHVDTIRGGLWTKGGNFSAVISWLSSVIDTWDHTQDLRDADGFTVLRVNPGYNGYSHKYRMEQMMQKRYASVPLITFQGFEDTDTEVTNLASILTVLVPRVTVQYVPPYGDWASFTESSELADFRDGALMSGMDAALRQHEFSKVVRTTMRRNLLSVISPREKRW